MVWLRRRVHRHGYDLQTKKDRHYSLRQPNLFEDNTDPSISDAWIAWTKTGDEPAVWLNQTIERSQGLVLDLAPENALRRVDAAGPK